MSDNTRFEEDAPVDIALLVQALVQAQKEIKQPVKNAVNPHFKNKFADLGACFDAVREPLSKNGLVVVQTVQIGEKGPYLSTSLLHISGQEVAGQYPLPTDVTPQQMGSAITYAKRYAICAMFCLVADVDEDGQIASDAASAQRAQFVAKVGAKKSAE